MRRTDLGRGDLLGKVFVLKLSIKDERKYSADTSYIYVYIYICI